MEICVWLYISPHRLESCPRPLVGVGLSNRGRRDAPCLISNLKETTMHYLLVLFFSICIILANAHIVKSESPEFAFTCDCSTDHNPDLSLIGTFPLGKKITLLSKSSSDICITKTLESFSYPFEVAGKDIPATHVDFKVCKKTKSFDLAYVGKDVSEYRIIQLDQNTSESIINHIDSLIRKKGILKKNEGIYPEYLSKKPILYASISESKNVYIVQYLYKYINHPNKKDGPLFFVADGQITKMDSDAEIIRAFMLNGRFFILLDLRSEGGLACRELLEIKKNQFFTIFVDCSWST